jgi:hypothetical protein
VSPVRPPVIAGLAPGSGTSTLAAALHARDVGVLGPRSAGEADVVVCRPGSLDRATVLACGPTGPRPLLAVLLDPVLLDRAGPRVVAQRLATLRSRFGAVVALPHVPGWQGRADVREEASTVLGFRGEHLPGPLRAYASALRTLVTALARSGMLARTAPPLVSLPSRGDLRPGLRTVRRVGAARPAPAPLPVPTGPPAPVPVELDDEALEALLHHRPVPAGGAG